MNKSIVIMAGLLFMSGLVFAAGGGQRTYDRWTNIIQNTQEAYDNLKNWDLANDEVNLEPQLAELEAEINTMRTLQSQLDKEGNRWNQEEIIESFKQAVFEARRTITPILGEQDLSRNWNDLREKGE